MQESTFQLLIVGHDENTLQQIGGKVHAHVHVADLNCHWSWLVESVFANGEIYQGAIPKYVSG